PASRAARRRGVWTRGSSRGSRTRRSRSSPPARRARTRRAGAGYGGWTRSWSASSPDQRSSGAGLPRKTRARRDVALASMQNTSANGAPLVIGRALIVAAEHQSVGRGDAAELLYREVLAVEPGNVDALLGLAAVRQSGGAHGDAEALLSGAL